MTVPIKHLNKVSGRFFLITLSQREGERREVRGRGRFVQFAISSPSHYYTLVKMYINTLNVRTTYDNVMGRWSVEQDSDPSSRVGQKWRPQQAYGSNQALLAQPQTIFSTPKILTLTPRERRGPQGTHAIGTIKTALWTTKWLTTVFPWPAQIQFTITKPVKT